ncbi:hypothetical protein PSN_4477 [Pseudomonas sp. NGC7]
MELMSKPLHPLMPWSYCLKAALNELNTPIKHT